MFYVTLWGKTAESWEDEEVLDNLYALSDSPVLLGELQALLQHPLLYRWQGCKVGVIQFR